LTKAGLAFLFAQLWARTEKMQASRVMLTGNPAGRICYPLTAMHGLHVIGGIIALLRHPRVLHKCGSGARLSLPLG
jgi:cytochrome c oxidase subunit III